MYENKSDSKIIFENVTISQYVVEKLKNMICEEKQ